MFKIGLNNSRTSQEPNMPTARRWESGKTNLLGKGTDRKANTARTRYIRRLLAIALVSLVIINALSIFGIVPVKAFTTRGPIEITSNTGFTSANGVVSGQGTASNPYIISGWEINLTPYDLTGVQAGISISNTNAYFVIKSVFIHDGYRDANFIQMSGVVLTNVQNGIIADSQFKNNFFGISLTGSNNNKITGNTVTNTALANLVGVYLYGSSYNTISLNTVSNIVSIYAETTGYALTTSSDNTLDSNTANGSSMGFSLLMGSSRNTLYRDKSFSNKLHGFNIDSSPGNTILSSTAYGNGQYGFLVSHTTGQNVISNTAYNNGLGGFYVQVSSNNFLTSNKAYGHKYTGVGSGLPVGHGAGFAFIGSNTNTAKSNIAFSNDGGFAIVQSSRNLLSNNTAHDNQEGFYMATYSNLNVLTQNQAYQNTGLAGMTMSTSSSNTLTFNFVHNNAHGFVIFDSTNETLSSNAIFDNNLPATMGTASGIYMWQTTSSKFDSNLIYNNPTGIIEDGNSLWGGGHKIYNNFLSNTQNVQSWWTNTWSVAKTAGTNIIGGAYLGGNFWSDYTGKDSDGDGLGDTTYRWGIIFGQGDNAALVIPSTGTSADFKLIPIPSSINLAKGNDSTLMVALSSQNSFTGTVTLTATISPTAGAPTMQISPTSIALTAGKTSASTIYLTNALVPGTYTLTVQATSGTLSHNLTITLAVK